MDLNECYEKGFIKKVEIDRGVIISLIEMADIKELAVNTAKIDAINISAYVSLAYDSLREILEAICISKGHKVMSHLCMGELLVDLLNDFDYGSFDRLRYARNGINYYGNKVDYEQGLILIKKMFDMKDLLSNKYLKEFFMNKK